MQDVFFRRPPISILAAVAAAFVSGWILGNALPARAQAETSLFRVGLCFGPGIAEKGMYEVKEVMGPWVRVTDGMGKVVGPIWLNTNAMQSIQDYYAACRR